MRVAALVEQAYPFTPVNELDREVGKHMITGLHPEDAGKLVTVID